MTSHAPRILVIGFEPFGGDAVNPAAELLAGLDGVGVAGHRVATALLPVTFADSVLALEAAIELVQPVIVLGVGQAGGRPRLSLERVAINLVDARIPDNAGAQPVDVPVVEGAPGAYFTTLPVKLMLRAMLDRGVPSELSLSAGTYVCNTVFFALRHLCETRWPGLRAGFLHVPYLPAQAALHPNAPALDLATMRAGLLAALEAAATHRGDSHEALGTLW
jgi:pyroglutamyl-peptidase